MAEEIVKVITIDTRKSERSIKDLKDDIKALKKELENTTIGSKDFDLKLTQLGQLQKEYKAINEEIVASSKPVQKQMFELARFGENLAKSYSAINAAIGLLSDGNEDVQKALLKTSQMIQLIQGLSGFAPMLRDIPKLIDNFKDWFRWLDPVEKKIDNIASNIAGIDVKKLEAANAPAGQSVSATAGNTVINVESTNQALADQNRTIIPLNEEWEKYNEEIAENKKIISGGYKDEMEKLINIFDEYNKHTDTAKVNMFDLKEAIKDVAEGDTSKLGAFLKNSTLETEALDATAKKFGWTTENLRQGLENLEEGLLMDADAMAELHSAMDKVGTTVTKTSSKVKGWFKAVGSTVWWTLLITAILTAISALWKWISGLQTAAKKQRELNKAINEGANAISAKGIVALKELSKRYKEVGDTADAKKKFLVDFKKEIEETGLAIRNVSEADDAFINNTDAYVNALKQRAKAQAIQSKAVELYQEYLDEIFEIEQDAEGLTFWQQMSLGMMRAEGAKGIENWDNELIDENAKKAQKKIAEKTAELEATLDKLFDEVFDLEEKSEPYFTEIEDGATDAAQAAADAKAEELKQLKQYYDDALKLFMDARTRELQEVNDKYDEQIALAKKHNQDTTLLEQAKQREINEIIKKYEDERLQRQKENVEQQLNVLQQQIERIRQMNDTSNLQEPQEQSFMTNYHQGFGKVFMAGSSFSYQSAEDVENQVLAQITYNNKILELTKSRIEQENALLNQQLEIEGLTADRRLEIERTLRENEMALSDAAIKNEADNINAYRSLQEKKNIALQNSLSVASDIFGSMAKIAGEETKAGKAFAVTQAVIDTYAAANSAYASMAGIPYVGPALGIAAAAAAIASGIANVKTILSTKVSATETSVSLPSGSAVTPPALSTPPIEYTRNLLGNKETDELNKPTKVYVLESDITDAQNRVKVTEDNASF